MGLFFDPRSDFEQKAKNLSKIGKIPDNWCWNRELISKILALVDGLVGNADRCRFHSAHIRPLLQNARQSLRIMLEEGMLSAEEQKNRAMLTNRVIQKVIQESACLPFDCVGGPDNLMWNDFDQDEEGTHVLLYRGISNVDRSLLSEKAYLSVAALSNESVEDVFRRYKIRDKKRICSETSNLTQSIDPVVHTTRNYRLAFSLGRDGCAVIYRIPKAWLLKRENYPIIGHENEEEIDFFYQIPKEFVHQIKQFIPDIKIEKIRPIQSSGEDDVITTGLPPPPKV